MRIVRAKFGRANRLAIGFILLLGSIGAWTTPAFSQGTTFTFSSSTAEALVFNPASITNTQVNLNSTQVLGRLNGETVFNQAFAVPVADPSVQAAFSAAGVAITALGGPAVVIGAPHLISTETTNVVTSTSSYSLAGTSPSVNTLTTIGPGTILTGALSTCSVGSLPSTTRPTCTNGGTSQNVALNETNFNTITTTTYTIDTATTNTTTTTLSEVWGVDGTVKTIGTVYTAVTSGAFDLASRFLRRLDDEGDEILAEAEGHDRPMAFASRDSRNDRLPPELLPYGSSSQAQRGPVLADATPRYKGWAEGYGLWSRNGNQGIIPGNERRATGMAGGFSYGLSPELTVGFGVDQGWQDIKLPTVSESAQLDMTQLGIRAGYHSGAVLVNAAAIFGFGDVDASRDLPGLAAFGSYKIRMSGVLGEAGYRMRFGNVRLVPKVGFDYINVENGAFSETGLLGLMAQSHSTDRTRVWGGLEIGQRFATIKSGVVDLSAYGSIVDVVTGAEQTLPVAFVGAPGVPLLVQGTLEHGVGFDTGAKALFALNRNAALFVRYDGQFRDSYEAHAASGGLKVQW